MLFRSTPMRVLNADGTGNVGGLITDYLETEMIIRNHREKIRFTVTNLASSNIFLGHDWLERHNPDIDWKAGQITFNQCPEHCDNPTNQSLDIEKVIRTLETHHRSSPK